MTYIIKGAGLTIEDVVKLQDIMKKLNCIPMH